MKWHERTSRGKDLVIRWYMRNPSDFARSLEFYPRPGTLFVWNEMEEAASLSSPDGRSGSAMLVGRSR